MIYLLAYVAGLLLTLIAGDALQADDNSYRLSHLTNEGDSDHD